MPLAGSVSNRIIFKTAKHGEYGRERLVTLAQSSWVEITENRKEDPVSKHLQNLWRDERGQDIAEYAVMLAVILVIVVGTIRLIGSNANNVFSQVGSAIQ